MKRIFYFFCVIVILSVTSCQKWTLFGKKHRSSLFRTEIKNNYKLALQGDDSVTVVDSTDDDVDFYYIVWNDSLRQEWVMRYNTKIDKVERYGVIEGLEYIRNLGEYFGDDKIFVLGGDGTEVFEFDIDSVNSSVLHIPEMDFLAGVNDDGDVVALRWTGDEEKVNVFNPQGDVVFSDVIDSLKFIKNCQVSLWNNKVYVLSPDKQDFNKNQIFIYDLDNKQTQVINVIHADFIAGIYKDKEIITLSWNNDEMEEHVYAIKNGQETDLGVIDGLKYIVNAGVTLIDNKVYVLGNLIDGVARVFVFETEQEVSP